MLSNIEKDQDYLRIRMPSSLSLLDQVMRGIEGHFASKAVLPLTDLKVVVWELVTNAIQHGNGEDPAKTVICHISRIGTTRFQVRVEDEGNGFDHLLTLNDLPDDPQHIKNRGLAVVHALAESVEFNSKGNVVSVIVAAKGNGLPGRLTAVVTGAEKTSQ